MITKQDTTKQVHWSSWIDRRAIADDLDSIGIECEDFYPTCRDGVWQLEAFGSARQIARLLDESVYFASVKHVQDSLENLPYALVMFRHFQPEQELDPRWEIADDIYDERRLRR